MPYRVVELLLPSKFKGNRRSRREAWEAALNEHEQEGYLFVADLGTDDAYDRILLHKPL